MDPPIDEPTEPAVRNEPERPRAKRGLVWLAGHAKTLIAVLATLGFAGVAVVFAGLVVKTTAPADSDKVANDWQGAVSSLGLTAVFPPTEEVQVGDLYAVEYRDFDGKTYVRSSHLAHVADVKPALRDHYRDLLRFPPTPPDFDAKKPVEAEKDIFADAQETRSLPIVALPDVVFATASTETVSGLVPFLRQLFSAKRASDDSVEIRIPYAETYGLPAAIASSLLDDFCWPDESQPPRSLCTEGPMRLALSSINWRRVYVSNADRIFTKTLPKAQQQAGLYLRFVRRIYLTRKIDYAYGSNTVVGEMVRAAHAVPAGAEPHAPGAAESPAVEKPPSPPASAEALAKSLGGTGAPISTGVIAASSGKAGFSIVLGRPLTIGFESITALPYGAASATPSKPAGAQK